MKAMKNDESTKDLVLSRKLTSFKKLTGLSDYHKLIVNKRTTTLDAIHGTGYYTEQQEISGVFFYQVKTNFFTTAVKIMVSLIRGN